MAKEKYYSTVSQSRFPIFSPLCRSKKEEYVLEIENQYGKFKIVAPFRLTQQHRNVLDALFCIYEKRAIQRDGTVDLLFSPTELKKFLNKYLNKKYKTKYWIEKLKELRQASITLEWKKNNTTKIISEMSIVERIEYEELIDKQATKKMQKMGIDTPVKKMYIRLSPNYIKLIKEDIIIYAYSRNKLKEFVGQIFELKEPLMQAFARFCITHQHLNMKLDDILQIIEPEWEDLDRRSKSKKRRIIESNFDKLQFLGDILLKNGTVFYKHAGQNTLFFQGSKKDDK